MPENTIITKIGAYDNPGVEKSLSSNVAISAENIKATGVHGLIEGTGITLVKDSENGTVTINGSEGRIYSAGPNINITNDIISGKDWSSDISDAVEPKLDTTAFSTVSGTFLTAHQPISADEWNSCYDTVCANSGLWGSEYDWTDEINAASSNAVDVTKDWVEEQGYLTAHQPISADEWNGTYDTVLNYSAKWSTESDWTEVIEEASANAYNSAINWVEKQGYLTAHQSLDEYATINYVDSGLELKQDNLSFDYNEINEISAINGSAIAQPVVEKLIAGTDLKIDNNVISVNTDGVVANSADMSFVAGSATYASGLGAAAFGVKTSAIGNYSFAEGYRCLANGEYSHAEGNGTSATGNYSHAEGYLTKAERGDTHAEGMQTRATGEHSHAEGHATSATEYAAHAEGKQTKAAGEHSHAEGHFSEANGQASHAEGYSTEAKGQNSHAEGSNTLAAALHSHAEGSNTKASGTCSHAEGIRTSAIGNYSHTEGYSTIAGDDNMHVGGLYNKTSANALFVIGNGSGDNVTARSDAFVVSANGIASASTDVMAQNISLTGLANTVANFGSYKVVPSTASITEPNTKIIYLIKDDSVSGKDQYQEWICTDVETSAYEMIGDTSIDLSDYYTKFETSGADELEYEFSGIAVDIDNLYDITDELSAIKQDNLIPTNNIYISGNNEIGISGKLPFNVDDSMYAVETSAGIYVGLNEYTTNEYFAGTFGTDFTNPDFILSGDLFSANENIKYMNLSINYKVDNGAGNPDFVYKNELKISGTEINENYVHYIPGYISTDSYSVFLNVQNNSPFKFTLSSESTQHTGDEIKINVLGIKYHYPDEYEEIVDENDVDKLIVFNKTITTIDAGDDSILVDDDDSTLDIGY